MRYESGARGRLWASQVAIGEENELTLRLYGDKGSLAWSQRHADKLDFIPLGAPRQVLSRSGAGVQEAAARLSRVPAGHPEGYLEAFANIYAEAARAIIAARSGRRDDEAIFPTVQDGLRGVRFVDACVHSHAAGGAWTAMPRSA